MIFYESISVVSGISKKTDSFLFFPSGRSTAVLHQQKGILFLQSLYHPQTAPRLVHQSAGTAFSDIHSKETVHQMGSGKRTVGAAHR